VRAVIARTPGAPDPGTPRAHGAAARAPRVAARAALGRQAVRGRLQRVLEALDVVQRGRERGLLRPVRGALARDAALQHRRARAHLRARRQGRRRQVLLPYPAPACAPVAPQTPSGCGARALLRRGRRRAAQGVQQA